MSEARFLAERNWKNKVEDNLHITWAKSDSIKKKKKKATYTSRATLAERAKTKIKNKK